MVDSADLGFYGAAWRFTDFCQHLYARSVYLQLVLKSCELPGLCRSSPAIVDLVNYCVYADNLVMLAGAGSERLKNKRLNRVRIASPFHR